MTEIGSAIIGLASLFGLLVLRMPLGPAMILVGMCGYVALSGLMPLLGFIQSSAYWRFASYDLSVIPLFLLMGQFAARSGLGTALFTAANAWLGHRRGGVAMAAVGGCAAFGAVCGSSVATAGALARVALPELRRYRYSDALATGALAAGGTLGILIPPSVVLIIYAVAVQANIVRMFEAALIPGLLALAGFWLTIAIYVRVSPAAGPVGTPMSATAKWRAVIATGPTLILFLVVIGGIYAGLFDPTEAAAVGAFGAGVLAVWKGGMDRQGFVAALLGTAESTAMIFIILLGAELLNAFLALSGFPAYLADLAANSDWSPLLILVCMLGIYLLLGCFMDSLAMIFLTVPIFWPIVAGLDFGLSIAELQIWFGILTLVVVELGLITPPIGLNVLIINSSAQDVPVGQTFLGTLPFIGAEAFRVILLVAFPSIVLFLPRLLE